MGRSASGARVGANTSRYQSSPVPLLMFQKRRPPCAPTTASPKTTARSEGTYIGCSLRRGRPMVYASAAPPAMSATDPAASAGTTSSGVPARSRLRTRACPQRRVGRSAAKRS